MDITQHIARRLLEARTEAGLSVIAVADAIGVVRQTYSKFEQAQGVPSISQLIALCKLYDKPIGYFSDPDEGEFRFHAFSAHLAKKAEAFRRISFSS